MSSVLFIHPDRRLTGIYRRHLEPHLNFDSAHDGLSGLRQIRQTRPRAIVSEYRLPGLSGLAVLKYVRRHPELYATPFIFLSAEPAHQDALGLGANAWLNQREAGPYDVLTDLFRHLKFN